jgi:uncharacterized protein YjgD (DUF1641 family)
MKFYKDTNELKDVCVTEDMSIPFSATNSVELIQNIKSQIDELINKKSNLGVVGFIDYNYPSTYNLSDVAFQYYNPRILENKLYLDLKILDTPKGKFMSGLVSEPDNSNLYRVVLTGVGFTKEDGVIDDYSLVSVNFVTKT